MECRGSGNHQHSRMWQRLREWVTGGNGPRDRSGEPTMRIYIIANEGMTQCREAPAAMTEGEIAVTSKEAH